jgi:hypothetical protein
VDLQIKRAILIKLLDEIINHLGQGIGSLPSPFGSALSSSNWRVPISLTSSINVGSGLKVKRAPGILEQTTSASSFAE